MVSSFCASINIWLLMKPLHQSHKNLIALLSLNKVDVIFNFYSILISPFQNQETETSLVFFKYLLFVFAVYNHFNVLVIQFYLKWKPLFSKVWFYVRNVVLTNNVSLVLKITNQVAPFAGVRRSVFATWSVVMMGTSPRTTWGVAGAWGRLRPRRTMTGRVYSRACRHRAGWAVCPVSRVPAWSCPVRVPA